MSIVAAGGIILDSYSLYSAGKDNKCKVSQDISKHIEELEVPSSGLKKLNQGLSACNWLHNAACIAT